MCARRSTLHALLALALVAGLPVEAAAQQRPLPQPAGALSSRQPAAQPASEADLPPELRTRTFRLESATTLPAGAAADAEVRLWVPMPVSGGYQAVTRLSWDLLDGDGQRLPLRRQIELHPDPQSGHEWLHLRVPAGMTEEVTLVVRSQITRWSERRGKAPDGSGRDDPQAALQRREQGADGESVAAQCVAELTAGLPEGLTSAELGEWLFDRCLDLARGAAAAASEPAPEAGPDGCAPAADSAALHTLFVEAARASGLPARLSSGHSLSGRADPGPPPGRIVWAEFFTPEGGWIPADLGEALAFPQRSGAGFARLSTDRFATGSGRRVTALPPAATEQVDFCALPRAERLGTPWNGLVHELRIEQR